MQAGRGLLQAGALALQEVFGIGGYHEINGLNMAAAACAGSDGLCCHPFPE